MDKEPFTTPSPTKTEAETEAEKAAKAKAKVKAKAKAKAKAEADALKPAPPYVTFKRSSGALLHVPIAENATIGVSGPAGVNVAADDLSSIELVLAEDS